MELAGFVNKKNIAVVGNSCSLFEQNYGEFIDSHDVVIRFNKPAIFYNGNEKTHGSKITLWSFANKKVFVKHVLEKEENIDRIKKEFCHNNSIKKIFFKKCTLTRNTNDIIYPLNFHNNLKTRINTDLKDANISNLSKSIKNLKFNKSLANEYDLSTGLVVIHWLSMLNPANVNIFGFDFKLTPTFSEKEKFDTEIKNRLDIRCNHNFEMEEFYIKNIILKENKNFRIY